MSILEGVRAANIKAEKPKFVIKSKVSTRELREELETDTITATDEDALQFIEYMIVKSQRLRELLEKKSIFDEDQFYQNHLFGSICLVVLLIYRKLS